ncbi:ATP-grasp domain-containing protein [Streptomyces mirabilis]|uniref:ATP-grasp domain-containing protein n=1 Tax=Streptomyces mirabilis TaxID=68239 RepID=UPI00369F762D
MAGTSLDMTVPRPGSLSQVYGVFGTVDANARTLDDFAAEAVLKQIPVDALIALEGGGPTLRQEALDEIGRLDPRPFAGAAGFDDWWTGALAVLNAPFALEEPRRLVTDKAVMYSRLDNLGIPVPAFMTASLSIPFLERATAVLGPRPVLKPTLGAGSRGVFRYRADLSVHENLGHYRAVLEHEKIDRGIKTLAVEYLDAVEVSVDGIVADGAVVSSVVHEKVTAKQQHPFVDRVMVTPPVNPYISDNLSQLIATVDRLPSTLGLSQGVLHAELRLREGIWYVLDVGVRPGMGLVAHAMHALTGIDPRLVHLRACLGLDVKPALSGTVSPRFLAACIACAYVDDAHRQQVTMEQYRSVGEDLRHHSAVIGWHLNVSEIDDALYRPDAGMSIGVGAADSTAAIQVLRDLIARHGFTTE